MKKRNIIAAIALTLGVTTLASCTASDKSVVFVRYWQTKASSELDVHEELTYDVTFERDTGTQSLGYSFNYENGVYKTTLTSGKKDGETIYTYTTSLSINVTFNYGTETYTTTDIVETEVTFLSVNNELFPLSSTKELINHTPTSGKPKSIEDCYNYNNYTISTTYDKENRKGETTVVKAYQDAETVTTTNTFTIGSKYTYIDNEQLLFALRAVHNSSYSATMHVYSPFVKRVQKISAVFATKESSREFDLVVNGEVKKETIPYKTVELSIKEAYSGESQTLWIASPSDAEKNPNHNVILRLETPLAYSFGKLIYNLSSIKNS